MTFEEYFTLTVLEGIHKVSDKKYCKRCWDNNWWKYSPKELREGFLHLLN